MDNQEIRSFTFEELDANPSLADGLVFLSQASDKRIKNFIVPAPEPERPRNDGEKPKPAGSKKQ